jgi:GcrA cell cycle regulator
MSVWTDERTEQLTELWADATLSLANIADRLGVGTRNMVAGKAHRMGLALRRQPNSRRGQRAAASRPTTRLVTINVRRRKARAPNPVIVEIIPANAPEHLGLTLLQTTDATCKYPRGDENFTFCGQEALDGGPYCSFHHSLCFTPADRRPVGAFRRAAWT